MCSLWMTRFLRQSNLFRSQSLMNGARRWLSSAPGVIELQMPALSPTMTTGNVGSWHKQVGEKINAGEAIVAIETDKAEVEYEALDDGYLAVIYADKGTVDVPIGEVCHHVKWMPDGC